MMNVKVIYLLRFIHQTHSLFAVSKNEGRQWIFMQILLRFEIRFAIRRLYEYILVFYIIHVCLPVFFKINFYIYNF